MLTPNEEACYKVFVERAMNWYGFVNHHVMIKKRKDSIMCVETRGGGYRSVPVLKYIFAKKHLKRKS